MKEDILPIDYHTLYKKWNYRILRYSGDAAMSVIPAGYTLFTAEHNLTNSTHIHKCYELCYSLEGEGEYICGGRHYRIEPWTIFLADPDVLHEVRLPQDGSHSRFAKYYYLISFDPISGRQEDRSATVSDADIISNFLTSHNVVCGGMKEFICGYFQRIAALGDTEEDYIRMYHATYSFLIETLYRLTDPSAKKESCIREIGLETEPGSVSRITYEASLRYIATHIYSKLTVRDVAESVHTSVRNLEYLYRKYMDTTVKNYILSVKIAAAASNLRMNAKVYETAEKLCFEDVSSFTRLFKKHMGITPKKYQQQCNSDANVFGTIFK